MCWERVDVMREFPGEGTSEASEKAVAEHWLSSLRVIPTRLPDDEQELEI